MNIDFTSETVFEISLEIKFSLALNSVKLFNNLFSHTVLWNSSLYSKPVSLIIQNIFASFFSGSSFFIHFSFLLDVEHFIWKVDVLLIISVPEAGPTVCHPVTKQEESWGEASDLIPVLIPSQDLG